MGRALTYVTDTLKSIAGCCFSKEKECALCKILLFLYMAFVLWAVIFKFDVSPHGIALMQEETRYFSRIMDAPYANLIPLKTISKCLDDVASPYFVFNLAGNFVPFVPLGFLLPCAYAKLRGIFKSLTCVAGFTLFLEFTQLVFQLGFFDVDDLILNSLAGSVGLSLYLWARLIYEHYSTRSMTK